MHQILNLIAFMTARVNVARAEAKDRGATATEYALLVTFIAIAIVAAVTAFGSAVSGFFTRIGKTVGGWAK